MLRAILILVQLAAEVVRWCGLVLRSQPASGPSQGETSSELDYNALCIDTNIFYEAGYAFDKGLLGQLDQFVESTVQVRVPPFRW
jgi:hypothetical protein